MHPRNPYKDQPPDFAQLAHLYPDFARYTRNRSDGTAQLDWSDPQVCLCAVVQLSLTLHQRAHSLAGDRGAVPSASPSRLRGALGAPGCTPLPDSAFAAELPAVD